MHWRGLTPTALRWSTLSPASGKRVELQKKIFILFLPLFTACGSPDSYREGGRAQRWPGELTMRAALAQMHWRGLTPTALCWSTLSPASGKRVNFKRKFLFFYFPSLWPAIERVAGRSDDRVS